MIRAFVFVLAAPFALGLAALPALGDVPAGAEAPAVPAVASHPACADTEDFLLGPEGLGAVAANHHKDPPQTIVCNEQCSSWYDDCSAHCEPGQSSMCTGLALASGWCFFCDCW
ncbi:MAG TPA: hypothetical protein VHQ65_13040 [Thermoanaerobaculia bacterium]|nr:hypothetical protein [Thermoanaerobaculia bacterium]